MHKSKIVILIIVLGALLAALDASAQQLVRVGYSGTGVAKNLHKTIDRAGLWKKRALDIRLIYFTSGATMAQAMVGNDLDIADSDVPAMLNAVSSGVLDGRLISVYINRFPFAFVVRNEIKSPDELKGKRLAISRFGSSSEVTTRMLLRQFKLDPDKDVNIIQVTVHHGSPRSSRGNWMAHFSAPTTCRRCWIRDAAGCWSICSRCPSTMRASAKSSRPSS